MVRDRAFPNGPLDPPCRSDLAVRCDPVARQWLTVRYVPLWSNARRGRSDLEIPIVRHGPIARHDRSGQTVPDDRRAGPSRRDPASRRVPAGQPDPASRSALAVQRAPAWRSALPAVPACHLRPIAVRPCAPSAGPRERHRGPSPAERRGSGDPVVPVRHAMGGVVLGVHRRSTSRSSFFV